MTNQLPILILNQLANILGSNGRYTVTVEERSCCFRERQVLDELSSLGCDVIQCEEILCVYVRMLAGSLGAVNYFCL